MFVGVIYCFIPVAWVCDEKAKIKLKLRFTLCCSF
jgi:hypothetical protein